MIRAFRRLLLFLFPIASLAEPPRVAVVFDEQVRGVFNQTGAWVDPGAGEDAVMAAISLAGLQAVDAKTVRSSIQRDQAMALLSGDQKASIAIGSQIDADYILYGRGLAKSAGQIMGSTLKSMQASAQLSLVNATSGEILGSASASATKPHIDEVVGGGEALAEASAKAANELLKQVILVPTTEERPEEVSAPVKITLTGLASYRHYTVIKNWIEGTFDETAELSGETYSSGTAQFSLIGTTRAPEFADRISREKFTGFTVNPLDVQADSLLLKVIVHE